MEKKQHIAIFTTASLPWMTGTAVNPLFRAAYLAKDVDREVTLVIPWLSLKDQELIYPDGITFSSPSDHQSYVLSWLDGRTGFKSGFRLRFYPAKFSRDKRSILPVGDITQIISDEEADIAVLEEPEHLTWYHHGKQWKVKFRLVIGVVHTNYLEYVKREKNGPMNAFFLGYINSWLVSIYCHKVIRLSAATQNLPRSIICNVHGVNPKFIEIGKQRHNLEEGGDAKSAMRAYYIGKMVWSKGYKELLELIIQNQRDLSGLEIDLYGSGEDFDQIKEAALKLDISVNVYPGRDHADPLFHTYKVFLNPSTSDVVCTTTAEALAMGKFVICANHPSNDFFTQFPNCRAYSNIAEFVEVTWEALKEEPAPLTDAQTHELSWEAATERFIVASGLNQQPASMPKTPRRNFASLSLAARKKVEDASAFIHYMASGFEPSRRVFGAIPETLEPDEDQKRELGSFLQPKA